MAVVIGLWSAAPTRSSGGRVDLVLLGATVALVLAGLAFVSVATVGGLQPDAPHVVRQLVAAGLGTGIAVVVALTDVRRLALAAPALYAVTVLLLAVVPVVAPTVNGARAWLPLGGVQLQPSEVAKVAVILLVAAVAHERRVAARGRPGAVADGRGLDLRTVVALTAVAAVPMGLILAQPDFGTFLVFVALTYVLLLVAGARVRHLAGLALLGIAAVGVGWQLDIVEDYQIDRLTTFLDAGTGDPQGAGWNLVQARIAVGAGGLTGRGPGSGEQSALGYVPENHTDFIFTVIAEATGFVGALTLLGLYAVILWRGLRIAGAARDLLGVLVAAGVVGAIGVQVFVGVGMTVGLTPVIGLPLPLVSFGGTSLVVTLTMVGLLQSVHRSAAGAR